MPRGTLLSVDERKEIYELRDAGMSGRQIAEKLNRSKTAVLAFLKLQDPKEYGKLKRPGRRRILSKEQEQRLYDVLMESSMDMASNKALSAATMSAAQIKQTFQLPLSTRRIQQLLSDWRKNARRVTDQQRVECGGEINSAQSLSSSLTTLSTLDESKGDDHYLLDSDVARATELNAIATV